MLYGGKNIEELLVKEVNSWEKENGKRVLFGSLVGSISLGIERSDSDYDTRFLYIDDEDNLLQVLCKEKCLNLKEVDVRHLVLSEEFCFDECIPYWEMTSFLNYLNYPFLDGKESNGLYHIVNWTIRSPYTWDPYGISNKIAPYLDELFSISRLIDYYKNYISNVYLGTDLIYQQYIYSGIYMLSAKWCLEKRKFPPVYVPTLLELSSEKEVAEAIRFSIEERIDKAEKYGLNCSENIRYDKCKRNPIIDGFIDKTYKEICKIDTRAIDPYYSLSDEYKTNIISCIFKTIYESIKPLKVKEVIEQKTRMDKFKNNLE